MAEIDRVPTTVSYFTQLAEIMNAHNIGPEPVDITAEERPMRRTYAYNGAAGPSGREVGVVVLSDRRCGAGFAVTEAGLGIIRHNIAVKPTVITIRDAMTNQGSQLLALGESGGDGRHSYYADAYNLAQRIGACFDAVVAPRVVFSSPPRLDGSTPYNV